MSSMQILAPIVGAGIGIAAAYGATHKPWKKRVHFVERDNLESELEELDIEISGVETCELCGDEIPVEDIGAIVLDEGEYKIICDKPKCLDTYDVE